ncbi:MAG: serine--tRNA ligase [Flavobacteriaceae bacterium]|nr:serine--tRNA ligase [Flavobacteriaceae bacterium]
MLDISILREHKNEIILALSKRGLDAKALVDQVIEADQRRRSLQAELDQNLAKANTLAKEIGQLYSSGKTEQAQGLKDETSKLKAENKNLQAQLNQAVEDLQTLRYNIPNVPHQLVPNGQSEEDNLEVFQSGKIPDLQEDALPHWELASKYNLINFDLGNKISGAGFPVYTGKGARLQRALIHYFLDQNTAVGYEEVQVPHLVNEASGFGTGQLPDKEGQMYHVGADNLYLIPTAEVPVTNLYRDVMLSHEQLPISNTGYTPCFRREAGSYGAHVRGLNRLHQFDKVEIVRLEHPDRSYDALDEMVDHVKTLLEALELPYRVLRLCGGDLGFTSALTYDFEVYSTAQKRWLEVSSVSNFESFQSTRLKLRFKDKDGRKKWVHTLNGSALALPRVLAALLENNQTDRGIHIPKALVPYTGFELID